jgi:hypothetical protein
VVMGLLLVATVLIAPEGLIVTVSKFAIRMHRSKEVS